MNIKRQRSAGQLIADLFEEPLNLVVVFETVANGIAYDIAILGDGRNQLPNHILIGVQFFDEILAVRQPHQTSGKRIISGGVVNLAESFRVALAKSFGDLLGFVHQQVLEKVGHHVGH